MSLETIKWAVVKGEVEGHPLILRYRQFPLSFPKGSYPERINVTWTMAEAASTGFPLHTEQAQLVAFEDRLVAAVEPDAHSVLSVVLTCNGKREWVFHTADVAGFLGRLTDMPQEEERYPIELDRGEDAEWSYDAAVLPASTLQ